MDLAYDQRLTNMDAAERWITLKYPVGEVIRTACKTMNIASKPMTRSSKRFGYLRRTSLCSSIAIGIATPMVRVPYDAYRSAASTTALSRCHLTRNSDGHVRKANSARNENIR
jgi:hypothetical protein